MTAHMSWTGCILQVTLLIDLYHHQTSGTTQIGLVKNNNFVFCFCIATAEVFRLWKKTASTYSPVQLVFYRLPFRIVLDSVRIQNVNQIL